jgi:hypothetical protein
MTDTGSPYVRASMKFFYYKIIVYTLLVINILVYLIPFYGFENGIDSIGWLLLLIILEWETSQMNLPYMHTCEKFLILSASILSYIAIIYTALMYSSASYIAIYHCTDMLNAWTWLLIVIILECEIYLSEYCSKSLLYSIVAIKYILYTFLFIYIFMYYVYADTFAEKLLDVWDAALWILCFFSIEINRCETGKGEAEVE